MDGTVLHICCYDIVKEFLLDLLNGWYRWINAWNRISLHKNTIFSKIHWFFFCLHWRCKIDVYANFYRIHTLELVRRNAVFFSKFLFFPADSVFQLLTNREKKYNKYKIISHSITFYWFNKRKDKKTNGLASCIHVLICI